MPEMIRIVLVDPTHSNSGPRSSIRQPLKQRMPHKEYDWNKVFPIEKLKMDREEPRQPHLTPIRTNS